MNIDWQHFTPYSALIGGMLIGLSAAFLAILQGRITGISGIVGGLLQRQPKGERGWRIAFIVGLLIAPFVYGLFQVYPSVYIEASPVTLMIAGLLVGLGTRYGGGCTSGHGICGLSRLSVRSRVATLSFMLAGFVTVYVLRHLFLT